MGNPEHLEWLREGHEAWNARRERGDFRPDFSDVDFREHGLKTIGERIDLRFFDLTGADLWEANLRGADLGRAFLGEAYLERANLRGADLGGANLRVANVKTVYSGAGTNEFSAPEYTNLSTALGLTQEQLDMMLGDSGTIIPGHLKRPPPPDWPLLEAEKPPATGPRYMISSTSKDSPRVTPLVEQLRAAGLSIAYWETDIPLGGDFTQWMEEEAEKSEALLAIYSNNYSADSNRFSALERYAALTSDPIGKKAELIPILLEPTKLPKLFGSRKGFYLYDRSVEELIEALKNRLYLLDDPTTTYTSPATFTTVGEKLDVRHTPSRSEPRQASKTPIDETQSQKTRRALSRTATTVTKALTLYIEVEQKSESNRVRPARSMLTSVEALIDALCQAESEFLPSEMQDYTEALANGFAEDIHAFEATDAKLIEQFITRARQHYAAYPELAEIADPENTQYIPDDYPYTADELTRELEEITETTDVFTARTQDLIRAEKAAKVRPGVDAEKTQLARLSAIAAEMLAEMKRADAWMRDKLIKTDSWLKTYARLEKIWEAVKPFIGYTD